MLDVPRSVRLAAWGTAALNGLVPLAAAVRAVTRDDEPHEVRGPSGLGDLVELLAQLRAEGRDTLRAVLPVPGDVRGLPGPAAFQRAALAAGECVVGDRGFAAVPELTPFGSELEPGCLVVWQVHEVQARPLPGPPALLLAGALAEAERELRTALATATEVLAALDVARWRDDAADQIAAIRSGEPRDVLPPSTPARSVRVMATALRVQAIVALAREDDGGAVTSHEAERRAAALRELDGVSRRALVAAGNAARLPD